MSSPKPGVCVKESCLVCSNIEMRERKSLCWPLLGQGRVINSTSAASDPGFNRCLRNWESGDHRKIVVNCGGGGIGDLIPLFATVGSSSDHSQNHRITEW